MSEMFMWNLLFDTVKKDIRKREDVIIILTHYTLIRNEFQCVGGSDDETLTEADVPSESLPAGWNSEDTRYTLKYVYKNYVFILKANIIDDELIVNLMNVKQSTVSCMTVKSNEVKDRNGTIEHMIPTYKEIMSTILKDLIEPVTKNQCSSDVSTQTQSVEQSYSDPRIFRPIDVRRSGPSAFPSNPVPFNVGGADLDPFGFGGGMIFPGPGARIPGLGGPSLGIPPGSLPPGARFDPFRPPVPDSDDNLRIPNVGRGQRHPPPDPDHFPPPGFDDMFM